MDDFSPPICPTPRRRFELTPASTESSTPPTPTRLQRDSSILDPDLSEAKRTRSILNLTSSTLFGIYSGDENVRGGALTPWTTGAQTPARLPHGDGRTSPVMNDVAFQKLQKMVTDSRHSSPRDSTPPVLLRLALLFCSGMTYGLIVRLLHDTHQLAPVQIEQIDRNSWRYLMLWGGGGVLLGVLLPWVDFFWAEALGENEDAADAVHTSPDTRRSSLSNSDEVGNASSGSRNRPAGGWDTVVRGVGAFIGIAFAIVRCHPQPSGTEISLTRLQRRLPWQSTLQVSLTLASINPVLWYLIDRSKPGFFFSSVVGIIGTAIVLGVSPDLLPTPTPFSNVSSNISFDHAIPHGSISNESIGIWTWMASVLFCSTLCFGNIGRKLALGKAGRRAHAL
ncbi:hypothetical protein MMC07_008552 [Pseudocyphellaria aurata]|nr:hypothetical protein [Pseudocyphellaria aurata]